MTAKVIALAAAALVTAGSMAFADTYYTLSNPRIIHVPQPGERARDSHASLSRVAPNDFDDDRATPPPSRAHRVAKPKAAPPKEPVRRKPFSVSAPPAPEPEPTGPRRALLSAPPPLPTSSIHDGPTPLKPTPRFGQPLPEPTTPVTTFTPPTNPVAAVMPPPEPPPAFAPHPAGDSDDDLPPPGDPKLAPPEPRD